MSTIQIKSSTVAGNVPPSLTTGELAINVADGIMYWMDSSGTIQGSPMFAATIEALASNNLGINAAMEVSQFNASSAINLVNGVPAFVVDQFSAAYSNSGGEFVAQQVAPPSSPPFGERLTQCLQLTATSAIASYAANDYAIIRTPIEGTRWNRLGYGAVGAASVTVGFWCYADVGGFGTAFIQNNNGTRSCPVSFAVSAGWQWVTVVVPGDVAGLWNTDFTLAAYVGWCFGCGSNLKGTESTWSGPTNAIFGSSKTTNFFSGNGSKVAITGVVILPGAQSIVATHGAFLSLPFDKELAACQRHFCKSYATAAKPGATGTNGGLSSFLMSGLSSGNYGGGQDVRFGLPMRTVPTLTPYSPNSGTAGKAFDNINGADVAATIKYIGEKGFRWSASNSAAATSIDLQVHWAADARMAP